MDRGLEIDTYNSVSFIYYPTSRDGVGHAELEVAGDSWDVFMGYANGRPLHDMIDKSTNDGYGYPFLRFLFKAEPHQIQKVQDMIKEKSVECTCSRTVLAYLAEAGVCTVPLPFSISPLLSAAYLTAGRRLKLNNIQKIEYYGGPSKRKNIVKMLPGVACEMAVVGLHAGIILHAIESLTQE